MKKTIILSALSFLFAAGACAQSSMFTSWLRNTNGKVGTYYATSSGMPPTYTWTVSTDSADVLTVAYDASYVYIRSNGMTDSMGKFLNPGSCISQAYKHKFPRTQTVPATKTISPKTGQIGLLINGIPIYGLSNSYSWNGSSNAPGGSGVWNVEVGKSEGFVLDANYGAHPQQQGAYHSHDKPYRLYKYYSTALHSPLIGYAFDGNPVYGPYGYTTALDASSGVTRMKTGYSLRNITTRTTLPYGVAASQTGPAVSTTYPIGTYCEDYEWLLSNAGDLDIYNGRYCVTPEYPGGTYAYFVTVDAAGTAAFPYYIGIEYYGAPVTADFASGGTSNTVTIPAGVAIYTGGVVALNILQFSGNNEGTINHLRWSLAENNPSSRITLERSADGNNFYGIANFAGSYSNDYNYVDQKPGRQNFYRLHITNSAGVSSYSSIVKLNNSVTNTVLVYPTITSGALNIRGLIDGGAATISIRDAAGRLVMTKAANGISDLISIDLSAMPRGFYSVHISNAAGSSTEKIVKE